MKKLINLSDDDWAFILESLNYTKMKFENYQDYPSWEFKLQRINEVKNLIKKIKQRRKNG